MSARQQFFPMASRPASRAAHLTDNTNNSKSPASPQFKPDLSNPLHQKSSNSTSSTGSSIPNLHTKHPNPEPKQLNLSSLKKPRHSLGSGSNKENQVLAKDNQQTSERVQLQNASTFKIQNQGAPSNPSVNVASPIPRTFQNLAQLFNPNASFTDTGFKLPSLSTDDLLTINMDSSSGGNTMDQAHISTQVLSSPGFTSPSTASLTLALEPGRSIGENGASDPHENTVTTAYGTSLTVGDYKGPQRILLPEDNKPARLQDPANLVSISRRGSMHVSNKRSRAEFDANLDEGEFALGQAKHPRDMNGPRFERGYMRERQAQYTGDETQASFHQPLAVPTSTPPLVSSTVNTEARTKTSAIDKLLGYDVDAYIESHMEKYEAAREQWKTCSMEEWAAGADELAHKFGQILDFVKDHMTAKVKLFATMNKKIDEHNALLDERSKSLVLAKEQLIKDSGTVLGR